MFTGIIEELGSVAGLTDGRLDVACRTVTEGSEVGASVSVNGVCLTVVERTDDCLAFDLSQETLNRTTLGRLRPGDPVNLERPVTLLTRLGGHLVQGHVDGVGHVVEILEAGDGKDVTVEVPTGLMRYILEKGSVTLDGVSLTVAEVAPPRFRVALIPHTLAVTSFGASRRADSVNVEVDVIAKYVDGLLQQTSRAAGAST